MNELPNGTHSRKRRARMRTVAGATLFAGLAALGVASTAGAEPAADDNPPEPAVAVIADSPAQSGPPTLVEFADVVDQGWHQASPDAPLTGFAAGPDGEIKTLTADEAESMIKDFGGEDIVSGSTRDLDLPAKIDFAIEGFDPFEAESDPALGVPTDLTNDEINEQMNSLEGSGWVDLSEVTEDGEPFGFYEGETVSDAWTDFDACIEGAIAGGGADLIAAFDACLTTHLTS